MKPCMYRCVDLNSRVEAGETMSKIVICVLATHTEVFHMILIVIFCKFSHSIVGFVRYCSDEFH